MYTYCHNIFLSLIFYVYFTKKKLVYRGVLEYVANAHGS